MRIGVDTRELTGEKAGKGWYVFHILMRLRDIDQKNNYVFYGNYETQYPDWPGTEKVKIGGSELLWHHKVAKRLKSDKIDLYWAPTSPIVPAIATVPTIMSIMDLTTLLFPDKHLIKGRLVDMVFLKRAVNKTKRIICISKATERDLIAYAPKAKGKTEVIYLGYDESFKRLDDKIVKETLDKYKLKPGYILSVGTLEPRKNIAKLIESYAQLDKQLQDKHPLVIVGKRGWFYEEIFAAIEKNKLKEKVKFLEYVPFSDLPAIYNGASVFVYPSLYEGFGLPPLEAMACGKPVIVTNVSSLPEVVGKAGILINLHNTKEIAERMEKLLTNNVLRKQYSGLAMKQAKKFSWQKCAKETLEIFNSIETFSL